MTNLLRRLLRIAVLGVLAVATGCAPVGPRFAVDGAVLLDPAAALASAETVFTAWLEDALASHDEVGCYLEAEPDGVRDGDFATDPEAWCGPVLTLDHDEDVPWMRVPLVAEADRVGRVRLEATSPLRAADTQPQRLLRADGSERTETVPALAYPQPPPLPLDHVERPEADLELAGRDLTSATSAILALYSGDDRRLSQVAVTASLADQVGEGRTRRIAPDGHELLVLEVRARGSLALRRVLGQLEIDGDARELDDTLLADGRLLVVVPQTQPLALFVRQQDVDQRLDLRSGEVERDPRATNALEIGTVQGELALEVTAEWTETLTFDDFRGGTTSFAGSTYRLDATCNDTVVSPFGNGWAPEGTKFVEVTCSPVAVGYLGELTRRALEASARLQVDGATLEPVDVDLDATTSWSGEVDVVYRFEAPVAATAGTFVFQGHAEFDGQGLQRFSPAASRDVPFDGAERP